LGCGVKVTYIVIGFELMVRESEVGGYDFLLLPILLPKKIKKNK
jgi:hypothetical protein